MLRCPACNREMKEVTARANPGSLIQLDQCAQCGGIWCDKWELFPIDPEEASELEALDEARLQTPVFWHKKKLFCPRCTAPLAVFKEPLLPPDIQLQRCRRCDGIWLNRGQLSRYKRHQKTARAKNLGRAAAIQKIPEVYSNPKSWVITGTKGMFAQPRGVTASDDIIETSASGVFKTVLQFLLRSVLGI